MIWYDLLEESQCQEQQFDSLLSPAALHYKKGSTPFLVIRNYLRVMSAD